MSYLPYTVNYTAEDSPEEITLLENVRESLQSKRKAGLYTAEIHQALLAVEQALLYVGHYHQRRNSKGIYTLPIPEDMSETIDYVSRQQMCNVNIRVVHDDNLGGEELVSYRFENTYLQAEIPFISEYIESLTGKSPVYYLQTKLEDSEDGKTATLTFILNREYKIDFKTEYEDARRVYTEGPTGYSVDTIRQEGLKTLVFVNPINESVVEFDLPTTPEATESHTAFDFSNSGNINRLRTLILEITEYAKNELGLSLLGNPSQPGVFYWLDLTDGFDTLGNEENKEYVKMNTFIQDKGLELLSRNFV